MSADETTVRIPHAWLWGVRAAGAGLGFAAAFLLPPLVDWLVELADDAPGPLRLAAALPLPWALPVLTVVGLVGGFWVTHKWEKDTPVVTVTPGSVTVLRSGSGVEVDRARVAAVFTDGRDLVLTDAGTRELLRARTDSVLVGKLRGAFARFDYPWQGTADPHDTAFTTWVDLSADLGGRVHELLRQRQRALADDRAGSAADARDALAELGIVVRDRAGAQQYRQIRG